jgi:nucleoside 2-deoxyribosyltransferase/sugar/nucleoside kinase (ribokinase family)
MIACNPCLIGQVFVDFVERAKSAPMMRLGGIMHAARTLWAMGVTFGFAYTSPDYLREDAEEWAFRYGASHVRQIGTIERCPNVVIVGEGKETGNQRYEYLLRDSSRCEFRAHALTEIVRGCEFTDVLIFPGGFPLPLVLEELNSTGADIFADINFIAKDLKDLTTLRRNFASLIMSTSSELFLTMLGGNSERVGTEIGKYADSILLKENRGGSRLFNSETKEWIGVPAQARSVLHSVGVGDCFNSVFVAQRRLHGDEAALAYASFAAAEYACYFDDLTIRQSVEAVLQIGSEDIKQLEGVKLPWETRSKINIYLAAPDFSYVDTTPLDQLADALAYHNFSPRRPVRENGQARLDSPRTEKIRLAEADLHLLGNCELMIAVLLYDDPGTLIEVGIALNRMMPVIVYDPFNAAKNLMLTELPVLVSSDLDGVVTEVFIQAAKIINDGE